MLDRNRYFLTGHDSGNAEYHESTEGQNCYTKQPKKQNARVPQIDITFWVLCYMNEAHYHECTKKHSSQDQYSQGNIVGTTKIHDFHQ